MTLAPTKDNKTLIAFKFFVQFGHGFAMLSPIAWA